MTESSSGAWGDATATFSADRKHRYLLTRGWDVSLPAVNFLMLNPSTADAFQLDPTNRRCVGFAQAWGYGSMVTTNIFAFRSTNPAGLRTAKDAVGPDNDEAILTAAKNVDLVIAAWGTHGQLQGRGEVVRTMLCEAGVELHALKLTKAGHPGHPLYVAADTKPFCWV
ncbi:MAG: DUF1643 domain-containing protein [Actinobacteria bacterium]|nr:DUF1643 domain-containing protein [Actinomycetota bacterium]MSZ52903.1 DUF1643 domain-containing protein [Actinomycetota bacterium]MTA45348.1 DUF1643 domain-containing protein [Actinomycetota bacterium]MTB23522.1 DUF1643 domain-containing protein [Actinomycetota bacterium]